MRERIHDSLPRQSSPSRSRDRDRNESSRIRRRDVSNRSDQSPEEIYGGSHGFDVRRTHREQDIDGNRRECRSSAPYKVERHRRDGFCSKSRQEREARDDERYRKHSRLPEDSFSGEHYSNRSDPTETVQYRRRDAEPFRSMIAEPEPSRFVKSRDYKYSPSHERNVLRNDKTGRFESNSRDYSDSSLCRLKPYTTIEPEQTEAIFVATKGEDGRDRDNTYIQASSPLSQVVSSGVDFQDESSKIVSLNPRCCIRVNDSDERRQDYSENRCASQVLQTRHFDDYVGRRNSPMDQQRKSFRDISCGDHDSPALSRCGKEINYQIGSDIARREFPSVRHDVKNTARETDLRMLARGSSYVNAADANLDFCTKERLTDQYESVKEHYPFEELGSRVVNEQDDEAHHYKNFSDKESNVVYLDNKCQLPGKDHQYDGVDRRMYLVEDRDDKAPQNITLCLNKEREEYLDNERKAVYSDDKRHERRNKYHFGNDDIMHSDVNGADIVVDREAYLDNERKAVYSDNKREELRNKYHHGNDGRMHSDVHGADIVVDQDGRVVQLRRVTLNKGKETYVGNERQDVYQHYKSQQLKKDYDSGTDARIYPDVNKSDILVDQEGARDLRYRRVSLNDRKDAYLQCESRQLVADHETNSYGMMHPNVNKSDILLKKEDARALKLRGGSFDDGNESYLDNERRNAYLRHKSHQLLKDQGTYSCGMMHPDVNKSDILVDREDARALKLRRGSFDDGKEAYLDNEKRDAYLRYERQQQKQDYDYGIEDRTYRDANSSDIVVDQGDAKALVLRRASFNDGNEVYLDNESNDVYQHYKIQQLKKNYDSGIDARMYHDVNRSEIVVDRDVGRALERRGVSLNDGNEAYLHYESQQLLKDHEIDSYGIMHPDVSRSSARIQDKEALRCQRYVSDDRNHVYLDNERLQLRSGGHVKVHANMRYPDGRQKEVYHSNDEILLTRDEYGLRDEAGEVIHENMVDDYNYSDVKELGMSYEKPDNGRFRDHEVAYDYRDKVGNYGVERGTSTEQFRYLVDERNFGNDNHTSTLRLRISAKERLGGRVEDSRVHVKYRIHHRVRNPKRKGKSKSSY